MKKKKVRFLDIYNSFSENERKEFMEFASISLFNKDGRNYTEFLHNLKTEENGILKMSEPGKDRTQSNRLSELTILAEKFLTLKNLDTNKFCSEIILLDELNKRDIRHFYDQRYSVLKKNTLQKKVGFEKINELYEINNFKKMVDLDKDNNSSTIETYYNKFDYRFLQFIIEILEFMINELFFRSADMSYIKSYRNEILIKLDFNYILKYSKNHLREYYPLISFYYYIYRSLENTDDTYNYYLARKIFTSDLKILSKETRSVLIQYLIEYNIKKNNDSKQAASKEVFYFINIKHKEGMLEENFKNDYDNFKFVDYVLIALSLKKFKWVENFINRYGEFLQGKHKEDAVFLCRAFTEYHRNNFKTCKENADKVKKINPYYYINATKLNLQSSFELNNTEDCYAVLRRLQEYIRIQKKTSNHLIDFTRKFCTSYVLLLRLKDNPDKKNYLNLEYDLAEGSIVGRKWIERKMKEIKY